MGIFNKMYCTTLRMEKQDKRKTAPAWQGRFLVHRKNYLVFLYLMVDQPE